MKIRVKSGIAATYKSITDDCIVFINARQQWEITNLKDEIKFGFNISGNVYFRMPPSF